MRYFWKMSGEDVGVVFVALFMWGNFVEGAVTGNTKRGKDKTDLCGPRSWHHHGDNKCFHFLDWTSGSPKSFEEAKSLCTEEDPLSTLPSIDSAEEEDFLLSLLGPSATNNIWLGGEERANILLWDDGLHSNYTNWLDDNFKNGSNMTKPCIQMETHRVLRGKWSFTDCEKTRNVVICQKAQNWAPSRIKAVLLETRKAIFTSKDMFHQLENFFQQFQDIQKELGSARGLIQNMTDQMGTFGKMRDDLLEANTEIQKMKAQVTTNQQGLENLAEAVHSAKEDIERIQGSNSNSNSTAPSSGGGTVPIGFIYIQYGNQSSPQDLWPHLIWTEITGDYGGQFFRAAGPGSLAFGVVQEENSPHLKEVAYKDNEHHPEHVDVNAGELSEAIRSGHWDSNLDKVGLAFGMTGGEVRPKNSAIRIWKRTS